MKHSSDTIVNRTRDLPACSAVPQPSAPPSVPTLRDLIALNLHTEQYKTIRLKFSYQPPRLIHSAVVLTSQVTCSLWHFVSDFPGYLWCFRPQQFIPAKCPTKLWKSQQLATLFNNHLN